MSLLYNQSKDNSNLPINRGSVYYSFEKLIGVNAQKFCAPHPTILPHNGGRVYGKWPWTSWLSCVDLRALVGPYCQPSIWSVSGFHGGPCGSFGVWGTSLSGSQLKSQPLLPSNLRPLIWAHHGAPLSCPQACTSASISIFQGAFRNLEALPWHTRLERDLGTLMQTIVWSGYFYLLMWLSPVSSGVPHWFAHRVLLWNGTLIKKTFAFGFPKSYLASLASS